MDEPSLRAHSLSAQGQAASTAQDGVTGTLDAGGIGQSAFASGGLEKDKTSKAWSCSHGIPIFWFYVLILSFDF